MVMGSGLMFGATCQWAWSTQGAHVSCPICFGTGSAEAVALAQASPLPSLIFWMTYDGEGRGGCIK